MPNVKFFGMQNSDIKKMLRWYRINTTLVSSEMFQVKAPGAATSGVFALNNIFMDTPDMIGEASDLQLEYPFLHLVLVLQLVIQLSLGYGLMVSMDLYY